MSFILRGPFLHKKSHFDEPKWLFLNQTRSFIGLCLMFLREKIKQIADFLLG
jgi:hypothetical protein